MTWNMDDPRWTAYAVGELADAERAELEAVLAANPEARAYVESLRSAIALIEDELRAQPAPALDDLQRQRIARASQRADAPVPSVRRRRWWLLGAAGMAAAASLAVVAIGPLAKRDAAYATAEHGEAEVRNSMPDNKEQPAHTVDLTLQLDEGKSGKNGGDYRGRYGYLATTPALNGPPPVAGTTEPPSTESYSRIDDNPFYRAQQDPLSTFSIDVDTASYSNLRRFLSEGRRPPKDAVRIEEMINYFRYSYPAPQGTDPFSISTEVGPAPWNPKHQLVRVGLQAAEMPASQVPPRNLVFLIDTSGSMQSPDKLPLLVKSLGMLVETLRDEDRVAIVAYAGSAGLVLAPTNDKAAIREALGRLEAGGSTNGAAGIQLAYEVAHRHLAKGINRVILCSDGDYNVGISSEGDLTRLIETEREKGVFLTVLGFGRGNLKDSVMEKLADRGNGNYAYIDSLFEAKKVLVREAGATLVTVAKDVKIQVEFNPTTVAGYRLVGYENRILAAQDFHDDKKDAGEIGAGHSVTALYEVVPAGLPVPGGKVDDLKYQTATAPAADASELMTVKLRYKPPTSAESKLLSRVVARSAASPTLAATSVDFRWAAAIAAFGMALRDSPHRGSLAWPDLAALAEGAIGPDPEGYRAGALRLIEAASKLPPATP